MSAKPNKKQQQYSVRKYKRTPFSREKYYPVKQRLYSWGAFSQPFLWGAAHGDWTVVLWSMFAGSLPAVALFNAMQKGIFSLETAIFLLIFQQLVATVMRLWAGVRLQQYVFKPETVHNRLAFWIQTSPERVMVTERFWAQAGLALFALRTVLLIAYYPWFLFGFDFIFILFARFTFFIWFVIGIAAMLYISVYEDKTRALFEENFDYRSFSHFKYEDPHFVLANKTIIPAIGFGTYKITEPEEVYQSVLTALETGYRLIDTATFYKNEEAIGRALKDSELPRESIFITSKIWNDQQGYVNTVAAFEESLARLGVDYLDMLLVHWPTKVGLADTWRALEDLYLSGRIKVLGVCNFEIEHLEKLAENARIMPLVNQIEVHPYFQRTELVLFCQQRRIQIEAWASLMRGAINDIEELKQLAQKYDKTPAQIALQWAHQKAYIVLPKSVTKERIEENFWGVGKFVLSDEDMKSIDSLDKEMRLGPDPARFSWDWPTSSR